ncbi:MarR family winged helix-turn-helix transcriptional regulator [Galactobacter caseinivorans]|uniref:MarR family transcriptional regulator n=1 Tax=Galactobacter caseinivorans TaxID=2676123 RepID=A0A496PGG3_9MICC|nr:MarR family winged helix-turn-helix transcriptional regulator [Galactobacter caseinivorans]RKW69567.1 MarR family transcriptional regulator [Galactobacter caseinivorans]
MSPRRPPRLVFLLTTAERSVRRWIDARGKGAGVTAATSGVLFYLASQPGATMSQLAAALGASPAGTTGLIKRMEASGLVERALDEADQRVTRVALTTKGAATGREAIAAIGHLNAALTQGFEPHELDIVARWLGQAAQLLDAPPEPD